MKSLLVIVAQPVASFLILKKESWLYFAGAVILAIGLWKIFRDELQQADWKNRVVVFGRLFFALPMAVFGAEHLTIPQTIAPGVPSWIPWHLFWVIFVGLALMAASLSITVKRLSVLAATLLSAMIFSFVLLIHVPNWAANPGNRFRFAIFLRDTSFSAGALACATAQAEKWKESTRRRIGVLTRYVIAFTAIVFGAEHLLHPDFVPVVPLNLLMPTWIPAHLLVSYVTGAVLIACGLSLVLDWNARLAATWLGIVVFAVVLFVYLPMALVKVPDVRSLNFLADTLLFCGTVLLLADLLRSEEHPQVPEGNREEPAASAGIFQGDLT